MDARAYFAGKKITVMGLGLLGRGIGDVRYLAECGANLIVTDLKTADQLTPSLEALKGLSNITFVLGEHRLEDFRDRDLILKAPKTPLDSIYITEAQKNGVHVTMSTALFARYAKEVGATLVGVTGTRGKTTTTQMIAHILKAAGKKVLVGGNIQGVSTLALLPDVTPDTIVVLELDSWQLQGFGAEKISPEVAVFTNLMPDHQDYYDGMDTYLGDKAEIFLHQKNGILIAGRDIAPLLTERYGVTPKIADPFSADFANMPCGLPGEHNRANAACAIEALRALGVDEATITKGLKSFDGVPGRLEFLAEKRGVKFYNDTTATTPEATMAALKALDTGTKNIVLIMGGSDKGLDMNTLLHAIPSYVKRLVMLPGSGTNRVLEFLPGASVYDSMPAVVAEAVHAAESGDIVLLSPAFASFGTFKNEYDRGEQFNSLVRAL